MDKWRRKFLKSKQWRQMRAFVINRDNGTCLHCGGIIFGSPEVHHKIELTQHNFSDPAISLNPDLLETLHHECHDYKHGRFGSRQKESIVDDDLNIDYERR